MEPIKYRCDCCGDTYNGIEQAYKCCSDVSILCGECELAYSGEGVVGKIHALLCAQECCEEESELPYQDGMADNHDK